VGEEDDNYDDNEDEEEWVKSRGKIDLKNCTYKLQLLQENELKYKDNE
jgi:hypothetical protein